MYEKSVPIGAAAGTLSGDGKAQSFNAETRKKNGEDPEQGNAVF